MSEEARSQSGGRRVAASSGPSRAALRHLAAVLRAASRLEPTELCYFEGSPRSPIWLPIKRTWQYRSRLVRLVMFWRGAAGAWWHRRKPPNCRPGEVVFSAFTGNQESALEPIERACRERDLATESWTDRSAAGQLRGLYAGGYVWSLPFFPLLCARMLRSRGHAAESYTWALESYWFSYGLYVRTRLHLRRLRPGALVLSNDHTMPLRVLIAAARSEGVPTFYVQHAAVSEYFPALSMDYALLDGRYSLGAYAKAGPSDTEVFLVGSSKLDRYANAARKRRELRRIGVCINLFEQPEQSRPVLEALAVAGHDCVLRTHPRYPAASKLEAERIAAAVGVAFSDGLDSPFEFLQQVDAVLAGDSGILLEAALLGALPIYYDFTGRGTDYYRFCEDGLCARIDAPAALVDYLAAPHADQVPLAVLRRYYANAGTRYAGRASELISEVIANVCQQGTPNYSRWRRVTGALPAWELAEPEV